MLRPWLWPTAVVQLFVLARPGWWKRWPPLPQPDRDYFRFRMVTAYGDPDHPAEPHDLVAYLEWCRRMRAFAARIDTDLLLGVVPKPRVRSVWDCPREQSVMQPGA